MPTILLLALCIVLFIQLVYYWGIFSRFSFAKPIVNGEYTLPVSVLICAKNEAENLEKNLPYILEQEYQNFQIVLINDASIDNTLKVMESFAHRDSRIKIVDVRNNEAFWGKKKYALTLGIKSAKNDLLIFTDADCRPAGKHWLKQMVGSFSNTQTIVLGFGGYQTIKHSLLNQLIRFETVLTAIQYFSYAISGMPYMGVGRNMAYHRDEFFRVRGFMSHMHIRSGEDDLFINEAANKDNIAINFNKESFTYSTPRPHGKVGYFKSKAVSTANYYKPKHKLILALFYFSQLAFWFLSILLFILQYNWIVITALIGIKLFTLYIVLGYGAKKLGESKLIWLLPFYEIILVCFQLLIFIRNRFSKQVNWK